MKTVKYIVFALLIIIINSSLIISVSPSLRHEVLRLLKNAKDEATNNNSETKHSNVKKTTGRRGNKQKIFPQSPKITHHAPTSKDISKHNKTTKLAKDSQFKHINSINQKDTLSSSLTNSENQGLIYVMSTPKGASVKIADKIVGKTPITVRIGPCGVCKVDVKLKYYETWNDDVEIYPSEVTKIHAKLKPGKGSLTVVSLPPEADIYVDRKRKGKTPLTIKSLKAGKHDVYVVKGKKEYINQVEILTAKNNPLNINLKVLKATLSVNSNPTGAKVYIDGVGAGTTPAKIKQIKIGRHQIVLVKGNSLVYVDSIVVNPEKENVYFATLENKTQFMDIFSAKIKINSELQNAYVYVDGSFRGTIPMEINNLRAGEIEIMLVKSTSKGSYTYKSKLQICSSETKEISIKAKEFKFKKLY